VNNNKTFGLYGDGIKTLLNGWKLLWQWKSCRPYILPSGKYYPQRGCFPGPLTKREIYNEVYETECDFMKSVLMKKGVDATAILKEDCAYEMVTKPGVFPLLDHF